MERPDLLHPSRRSTVGWHPIGRVRIEEDRTLNGHRMESFDRTKRIADVTAASIGLVAASPIMLAVAIWILVTSGRPVFFKQRRAGRHGRPFVMLKFRTLPISDPRCCEDARSCRGLQPPEGWQVTPFARFLRRSGLDELPQLISVLRGEMSLVGPRPLLLRYLPRYTPEQARRHEVLPGITGWAQVNGRTDISWSTRLEMDVYYVDHRSFVLDAKIIWRSIAPLWRAKEDAETGARTSLEFVGSEDFHEVCPVTLGPVGTTVTRQSLMDL